MIEDRLDGRHQHAQIIQWLEETIPGAQAEGLGGGGERQWNTAREMFALERIDPGEFVEVGYVAGNLHAQVAGIEGGDAADSADSCKNCAAEFFGSSTVWAGDSHACDYDTLSQLASFMLR